LGTVLALLIMWPIFRIYGLGAGCVKAQMPFAAWICAALPLLPALAFIAAATIAGLIVTFVYLRTGVVDLPDEGQISYAFPAQITMTVVAVAGVIACWMISYPT
jgi:hypothetical protein